MTDTERLLDALRNVMHPEIKRSLVDLGMIKGADTRGDEVTVTLALPFKEVPIRDELIGSVERAVEEQYPGRTTQVKLTEMSQPERAAFMAALGGGRKLAQSGNYIDHVVAVLSGKGGVGKSSVAALLAVALRRRGKRIGILDADITGPSIPRMFGLRRLPPPMDEGILPATTRTGIKVISINLLLEDEQEAVIWRGPLVSGAIQQFWTDVVWGQLDYLIVDLPPGTSDASLTVMQSIPLNGVLLVSSPQDLAGMVVAKAAHMAQQMKAPILGLIENMGYLQCPKCGERVELFGPGHVALEAQVLGAPFLGVLPLDPQLARDCDSGRIESYPGDSFRATADTVAMSVVSA